MWGRAMSAYEALHSHVDKEPKFIFRRRAREPIHAIPEFTIYDGFLLPWVELPVATYLPGVNHVAKQRPQCILIESMSTVEIARPGSPLLGGPSVLAEPPQHLYHRSILEI